MSKLRVVISVGCVFLIALLCVPQVAMSQEFETNPNGDLRHIPGFSTEHRQKRSLKMLTYLGIHAWKVLTLGATKVESKLANVRQYEKKGDYRLAVDQFLALEPKENWKFLSDMKGKMTGMSAQVGDRTVTLKFPSSSQFPGSVTIQMYKTSGNERGRRVDVIKYVE